LRLVQHINDTYGSVGDIRDTNDFNENNIPYMSLNSWTIITNDVTENNTPHMSLNSCTLKKFGR